LWLLGGLACCAQSTSLQSQLPAPDPTATISVSSNLPYGQAHRQRLDVYQPDRPAPGNPVVIFFYGGGWRTGQRGDYQFIAQTLAAQGIVTVIPDYRLYPEVKFPTFVQDSARAVAWTKTHIAEFGGNPRSIFVMGDSAGAYIAAMLTLDPEYLQAVGMKPDELAGMIGVSGPYDTLPQGGAAESIFDNADIAEIRPISFAEGKNPPLLLLSASRDDSIDPANSVALAARVRSHGGSVQTIVYPNVGHIGIMLPFSQGYHSNISVLGDVFGFIRLHTPAANGPPPA
jgi:acetyl esterase/lipase